MDSLKKLKFSKNDTFSFVFGTKLFDRCFDFNLSEHQYIDLLRYVKNSDKWTLISKENIKIFYYYDLKLIAKQDGNLFLEKDKLKRYSDILDKDNKGIRFMVFEKIHYNNLDIFPGLDKLNDVRKIREIVFEKNDVQIKFQVVNHVNKIITFEVVFYSNDRNKLLETMDKMSKFFKLENLTKNSEIEIEDADKLALSII